MDKNKRENTESFLFNINALQKSSSGNNNLSSDIMNPEIFTRFNDAGFHQKFNLDGNFEIMKKKRGRKKKPATPYSNQDPQATLTQIIDNIQEGEPAPSEKIKNEKRKKKIDQKRKEKQAIKNGSEDQYTKAIENSKAASGGNELTAGGPQETSIVPRIIMKDGKAIMNPAASQESAAVDNNQLQLVEEKKTRVTSMSFRPRVHTEKWTEEETRKFLKAIEIFGSDFTMISKLFPKRNRAQIKNKFRKEEKDKPADIDNAFKQHRLSSKRSLKDRIKNFQLMLANDELPEQRPGFDKFNSNSSLDSMDKMIIGDIQNIFLNEIHGAAKAEKNNNKSGLLLHNGKLTPHASEIKSKENTAVTPASNEAELLDEDKTEEAQEAKPKNLLFNAFK